MGCFGPDAPKERNYAQETRDTLQAQLDLAPQLYEAEAEFGPLYNRLNLQNLQDYLVGQPEQQREVQRTTQREGWRNRSTGETVWEDPQEQLPALTYQQRRMGMRAPQAQWVQGMYDDTTTEMVTDPAQRGLIDLYAQDILPQLTEAEAASKSAQRSGDIADVSALGPQALEAMRAANPQQAALMDALNQQALQQVQLGSQVDPDTARMMGNQVMADASNRGWGYSPADQARKAMAVGDYGERMRAQRQGMGAQAAGLNQAVYGDPFMQVLGRQGQSFGAMTGIGQQGMNNQPGQLFNPESAYAGNLYNSNFQTDAMMKAMTPSTFSNVITGVNAAGNFVGNILPG